MAHQWRRFDDALKSVGHSAEIDYVFNTLVNKTPAALSLSENMQDYWISFATSLDPNDNHGNTRRKCNSIFMEKLTSRSNFFV